MAIATINPATGETVKEFTQHTDADVQQAITAAHSTVATLAGTGFGQRAEWMRAAADLLDADNEQLATTITTEMGKTLASARAEVSKCAKAMRYFADHAQKLLADVPLDAAATGASRAFLRYQPLGVVLAVMPWNFPMWQVIRFAAPALMVGNTGLLKHSSNVPQTALYLGELFTRAGFPQGCFSTLLISSAKVEDVLRDPRVKAATLTGSEPAGRSVASIAGGEVKKTVLELGGSDPYLVMPSADLEAAAKTATTARVQNNGQSCIAAKRFIVHADVYDDFVGKFVANFQALKVGDPMAENTDIGPLSTEQGRTDVEELVDDAVAGGATVLTGGNRPDRPGWFYEPTVVADVTPKHRMYTEEVFGPVASVFKVDSLEQALEIANATDFGLGSNAWTNDPGEQEACINGLDAGQVFINGMTASSPELPFGGVKNSGYGRELSGLGITEFTNAKTIWVK